MKICARPDCTNEVPPEKPRKRGPKRKYCTEVYARAGKLVTPPAGKPYTLRQDINCAYLAKLEADAERISAKRTADFTDGDISSILETLGLDEEVGTFGFHIGLTASDLGGDWMPDCENAVEGWVTIGSMDIVRWTPEEKAAHEARAESFGRQSLPWEEPKYTPHRWAVAEAQATNEEAA